MDPRATLSTQSAWWIEETFRDAKSRRFGWALEEAFTSRPERVDVMVLLASLASLLTLMIGIAAEARGAHHAFQANTDRSRRVLSLPTLGRLVLLRALGVVDQQEFSLHALTAT